MSIKKFIYRGLSSLHRSYAKKKVLNSTLNKEQRNDAVVNLHRIDTANAGDFYCAPYHYFEELKEQPLDLFDYKSLNPSIQNNWVDRISNNTLIIGGGGLLNRGSFEMQMKLFESLADKGKKIVIWGAGHNSKDSNQFGKIFNYNIDVSKFDIVGTRDLSAPGEYVPCVSCLHPILQNNYTETNDIGLIYHKKTFKDKKLIKRLDEYPSISNTSKLEEIIAFIGSCNKIVTDSYHAMYWSFLMAKKVGVIPNSSKFFDFKYKPIFTSFESFNADIKKSTSYNGVLEECQTINKEFAGKVFNYLNL